MILRVTSPLPGVVVEAVEERFEVCHALLRALEGSVGADAEVCPTSDSGNPSDAEGTTLQNDAYLTQAVL